MAIVELIYDVKPLTYIAANPTKVLSNGEPIYYTNGQYSIGDGTTQLSSLPLYGGVSVSPAWGSITGTLSNQTDLQTALNGKQNTITTGTTSQYLRGDLSLATFPTNVSSFTNDSGYITSSALSPYLTSATAASTYLTIANAASTYQPIGSYLTGLTVGTTGIASGTNTRILYNNAGVLGEYAVTGTGTTAVLSTSPVFGTDITTPKIIGNTAGDGLVIQGTVDNYIMNIYDGTTKLGFVTESGTIKASIGTQTNHRLGFFTNNSATRMYLDTNGRLSIGKPNASTWAAPASLLELQPQSATATDLCLSMRNSTDTDYLFKISNTGITTFKNGTGYFTIQERSAGIPAFYANIASPSATNYFLMADANNTYMNTASTIQFRRLDATICQVSSVGFTMADAKNIVFNATTGTKIGTATTEKLAFWNATPIVQPTTAVAAATFVANTSAIANDTATFDGYTIGQIVKALRNAGLLA